MSQASRLLVACKHCQHEFRLPASFIGRQISCPICQRQITIAESKPEDRLVGTVIGGCRLLRRLGAGALGVVYEAEQLSVGRRVAIKMLSSKAAAMPEVVARFEREAKLSAAIQHPHVVGVYDCGVDRGVHYLTMEFVDGTTLAGLAEEQPNGRLDPETARAYIRQCALALACIHGKDIIHRDIKPANILVTRDGVAKLADLGLAKRVEGGDANALTMQGTTLGSPAYMPPEQIRDAREARATADIYALGATWYQIVSGRLPFSGRSATEVMVKVLREPPPPLAEIAPQVPPAMRQLIERMMAKDPQQRPQSAEELVQLIDGLDRASVDSGRPRRGCLRRAAALLVLLALGAAALRLAA
ncbi:MAG: serine/threonine-protein kinase [Planctomycetota bacterium]|nr:serine/threonine protein kinase [Planctomycetota bacterium]MDW8372489.1 serine/threonine-protein kinase [Planctomycetota bacterium]